ncbi:unnamed protein product [Rangifer tarandus platyrhynchus]|uniref:Uncharacterized protein n=2 Tax=Rangifer tarandus platyrhynchus TaxID=3082113 RepID=A0ACB0DPW9_RANTA|nr:unnamed protein product [Rangifer tarandus platyrhynchus]CAI9690277.1 unnamed protein product [Rangifer tarandus platyrhynchus]
MERQPKGGHPGQCSQEASRTQDMVHSPLPPTPHFPARCRYPQAPAIKAAGAGGALRQSGGALPTWLARGRNLFGAMLGTQESSPKWKPAVPGFSLRGTARAPEATSRLLGQLCAT